MAPQGGGVSGSSRAERFVLGSATVGDAVDYPRLVAWDAATGRLAWHRKHIPTSENWDDVALLFINELDGRTFWLSHVIDPLHGVQQLIFDHKCWAGPQALPEGLALPAGIPQRNCPELADTFREMVRAQVHFPHVE